MQKCSLLLLVYLPKALIHFTLTTCCIICPTGFSFNEVVVSGGECRLKLTTELLLMATLKMVYFISIKVQLHNLGCPSKAVIHFCIV